MSERLLEVSWSKLKTFEHCKQKAWLQGNGFRSPSTNTRVFFKGTVTDRILRDWIQDPGRQLGQMPEMVDEYVALCEQEQKDNGSGVVRWKHAMDKQESSDWCREALENLEPIIVEHVLPYYPNVLADKHLNAIVSIPGLAGESRDIKLRGILDILIDAPDFIGVYDLKATENESYWKQTIMQLVFYHLILKHGYDKVPDTTALIQPMCREKIKYISINEQHELNLMQKVISYAHSVWKEDFAPKESDAGCLSWCEVSHACVKFKKNEDGRLSWT